MTLFYSLLFATVVVFGSIFVSAAQTSAASPAEAYTDQCMSNMECPISKFCNHPRGTHDYDGAYGFVPCDATSRRCMPRLGPNEKCQIGGGNCADGLYCAFPPSGADPVCKSKIPEGATCPPTATYPCVGNLICSQKDPRCRAITNTGIAGEKCIHDRDCNQEAGFYCKNVQFPQGPQDYEGTCTKKKLTGEPCDRAADNFECAGYCLRLSNGTSQESVCMDRRQIGQSCSDSRQCEAHLVHRRERIDDAICNVQQNPGYNQGICVTESDLLRKPGQACDPAADLCDARRKLRCEKFNGKFVCVQKSKLGEPCTRGSHFSFCSVKSAGAPLECRRTLSTTKKIPFGTDVCSHVREIVKLGHICNQAEYAICETGKTCIAGPGIVPPEVMRYPPPPLAYCMSTVPIGGDCTNRFSTACVEGSFCINNKCQKAEKEPEVSPLYSGISVDCTSRACAPGLACKMLDGRKSCQLQSDVAGPWEMCSTTASKTIVCAKGTECTRGLEWAGIKRCRPVAGIGAKCEKDNACKGDLKCSPSDPNDFLLKRTCYDPKKAVKVGEWCDPKKSTCVVGKNEYQPAKCLLKWKSFACQVEATLFQYCSPDENIGCSSGLTCINKKACVPNREAV